LGSERIKDWRFDVGVDLERNNIESELKIGREKEEVDLT
jgi:hypothetical protein